MSGFVRGGPRHATTTPREETRAVITEYRREVVEVSDSSPRLVALVEPVVVGDVAGGAGLLVEADLGVRVAELVAGLVPLERLPPQGFTYEWTTPSTVVLITHPLRFVPAAAHVRSHDGTTHHPQVTYPAPQTVQLRFRREVRGTVWLS